MAFSVFLLLFPHCFVGRELAKSTLPLCQREILLFSILGQTKVYELITDIRMLEMYYLRLKI